MPNSPYSDERTDACDKCGQETRHLGNGYNRVLWCESCGYEEHDPELLGLTSVPYFGGKR